MSFDPPTSSEVEALIDKHGSIRRLILAYLRGQLQAEEERMAEMFINWYHGLTIATFERRGK